MVCSPSSSSARRERPGRSQRLPTAPPASAVAAGFADSSRTSAVLTANTPLTKTETIRLAMTGYHPASPVTWPIPMNCPAKPTRATNSSGAPRPRGARSPPDDNQIAGRLAHNSAQRQRGWSLAEQRDAEHGRKCQRPDVADRCHHAHRPAPHRPVPEGHADPSAQAGESTPPHGRRGGGSGRGEKKQQADQRSTDLRVSRHDDARVAARHQAVHEVDHTEAKRRAQRQELPHRPTSEAFRELFAPGQPHRASSQAASHARPSSDTRAVTS